MRLRTTSTAGALALAAMAAAATPAYATGGGQDAIVTPKVDCVQSTQAGYVAHFTYEGEGLRSAGEFIAAGKNTGQEKNLLSIASDTQGAGQQDWIERFYDSTDQHGFQVYFAADSSVTWTVKTADMNSALSATATAGSPACQAGEPGAEGSQGEQGEKGDQGEPGETIVRTVVVHKIDGTGAVLGDQARSSNRVAKLRIKADRGDVIRKLKVSLEGKRQKVRRLGKRTWRARIDLRGLKRGVYVVRVTARVNGHKVTHKHLYRVLYGNPRGGDGESLNRRTIVRL